MDVYMFGLLSKGSLLSLAGIDFGSQTIKAVTLSGRPGKVRAGAHFVDILTKE